MPVINNTLEAKVKLRADEGKDFQDMTMPYQLVDNLIYLTLTHLDISYAISMMNWFNRKLRKRHWDAVQCMLEVCERYH